MTPERAAAVLGVAPTASPVEIEKAFGRIARVSHPDRFAGDEESARSHAREFTEAEQARAVLLRVARARAARAAAEASAHGATGGRDPGSASGTTSGYAHDFGPGGPGPLNRPLFATWLVLLALAAFLAIWRGDHPFTVAEPIVRGVLLMASLAAYALTGRRPFAWTAVAVIVANVLMTLLFPGLGGLLGLLLSIPASYGLALMGIARRRRAAALADARSAV